MNQSPGSGATIRFGGYEVDAAAGELRRKGRRIALQEQPFQVLVALLEKPGEVVTREYLRERLWPGQPFVDFDQGVNTAINKLRDALGDSAANPRFVETVPRRGYRFTFPVDSALDEDSAAHTRERPTAEVFQSRRWAAWAAAVVAFVSLLGAVYWVLRPSQPALPLRRFTLRTPAANFQSFVFNRSTSISPDGKRIAFISDADGVRRLWIQSLEQDKAVAIEASEGAADPFWSPDSRFVGFALPIPSKLMRVPVEAGGVAEICPLPGGLYSGATWSPDGSTIVFGSGSPGALFEVPATGGAPRAVVSHESFRKLLPAETKDSPKYLHTPQFLPLGKRRVIVFGFGFAESQMLVGDLDTGRMELLGRGRFPAYSPTGHLLFQSTTGLQDLWAQPFSLDRLRTTGPAFVVVRSGTSPTVSADGTLVYVDPSSMRLVWLNRRGEHAGDVGAAMQGIFYPVLSPDGRRVAFEGRETENLDIWVHDLTSGTRTRLSSDPATEILPVWSPDGEYVAYSSWRTGGPSMYVKQADGGAPEEPLTEGVTSARIADWSRDGRYILYNLRILQQRTESRGEALQRMNGSGIWYLQQTGGKGRERHAFPNTSSWAGSPKLSPDGRYVAYLSSESGREELYVAPFPEGGRRWTISTNGAAQPRWSRNSHELFYVERGTLMAVPVRLTPEFSAKAPLPLFGHTGFSFWLDPNYDAAADGERFLVPQDVTEPNKRRLIHVVQNWIAAIPSQP